ncbi:carboxymuconolactone decarboxylase family protein [Gordonia humi]|uniref:Alkylhydroperoxidase family enzyme n=1 Tax=Gordonia humi TaxID=686429 RepID=A0A840ET91_9ACTN|nr:carboxymuconolactone decarboxylase family protein [Gordonia humi]MBB4134922.1 alkylhydroperoxidase family enzyme [Gordonia humi]
MGEPLIRPVGEPTTEQAALLAKAPTLPDGTIRNLFLTLAWHPTLLKRFNAMMGVFMRFNEVPDHDREVCILRVAARVGSRYELAQHIPIAQTCGVDDDLIEAVVALGDPSALPERAALLCAVADQILESGRISDDLWTRVREVFADESAALELVMLICLYRAAGDFMNIVGVAPEPDMEELLRSRAVDGA